MTYVGVAIARRNIATQPPSSDGVPAPLQYNTVQHASIEKPVPSRANTPCREILFTVFVERAG